MKTNRFVHMDIASERKKYRRKNKNWKMFYTGGEVDEDEILNIWMRKSQLGAFEKTSAYSKVLINKPTGIGKSMDIKFTVAHKLSLDPSLKAIIIAPQLQIAEEFIDGYFLNYPDGSVLDWGVDWDFCSQKSEPSIKGIQNFLKAKCSKKVLSNRILVTTHASFARAFEEDPDCFRNVLVCIDEAHHIQLDHQNELILMNGIGGIVEYSFKYPKRKIQLLLTTATFHRGDRLRIIPQEYLDAFTRFDVSYYEYFVEECEYLESFSYSFGLFDGNHKKALMDAFKEGVPKTIGYVPPVNSNISNGKHKDVHAYYCAIAQSDKPKVVDNGDGSVTVYRGKEKYIGVNLVEESHRRNKRDFIKRAHKHSDNTKLDFVIALNMFKEGANWRWAEKIVVVGFKKSLTDLIQCIGRGLRDAKGKKDVEVLHLIPRTFDTDDKSKYVENFNDFLTAIFMSMLLEDVITTPTLDFSKKGSGQGNGEGMDDEDYLSPQVDENTAYSIQEELAKLSIKLCTTCRTKKEFKEGFISLAVSVLKDHGVKKHLDKIAENLRRKWVAKTKQQKEMAKGLDVKDVEFNAIAGMETVGFMFYIVAKKGDKNVFEQVRDAIVEREGRTLAEHCKIIGDNTLLEEWDYEAMAELEG